MFYIWMGEWAWVRGGGRVWLQGLSFGSKHSWTLAALCSLLLKLVYSVGCAGVQLSHRLHVFVLWLLVLV